MSEALAAQIGVEGIFYASLGFVAAVSAFWPWWRTELGWSIVAKSFALTIAVLPAMVFYWLGSRAPGWLTAVAIAGLWAVPLILGWRATVIWRIQRTGSGEHL